MIAFATWVNYHSGQAHGPLFNLYLLPIVTSALGLGQKFTLVIVGAIAACYVLLGLRSGSGQSLLVVRGQYHGGTCTHVPRCLRNQHAVDRHPERAGKAQAHFPDGRADWDLQRARFQRDREAGPGARGALPAARSA
jgi:hypothetical protein